MAVTLKDIAARAGVSIGTVERALKNKGRIRPEVAERIRALAKEMDYRPNTVASGLVNRSKNYKIAVLLNIRNDFWDTVIKGIDRSAREIRDYGIKVEYFFADGFSDSVQVELIDRALAEGANALVIVPINSPLVAERVQKLLDENIPVVFLNTYISGLSVLSSIHCDYYRSGRIAASMMRKLSNQPGHVMAILPPSLVLGNTERRSGIRDYFSEHTDACDLTWVMETTKQPQPDTQKIREALDADPLIRQIIFNGDMRILHDALRGLDRQVTIIVFDMSDQTRQALLDEQIQAVIGQSQEEQGYNAIQVLFHFLVSGKKPKPLILNRSEIYIKESVD